MLPLLAFALNGTNLIPSAIPQPALINLLFGLAAKIFPQSHSGSRSHNWSWNCSSSRRLLLLIMTLAALMPLPQARHLHDQVALDYAYDEDASGLARSAAASITSSSSSSSSAAESLPAWNVNPFHGLEASFGEGSYDNDVSLSESSYEEIAQVAMRAARRELRRQRTRHARSHSLRLFSSTPQAPEWENPCGGHLSAGRRAWPPRRTASARGRVIKRRVALRNITMSEYQFIRSSAKLEYGNYQHWQREYKFLPNMTRPTNAVKLKTWYRNMQTFVGSFSYLGRAQYKYRKEHQQNLNAVTHELHDLLVSARSMLCEIETTINASYPNSNGAKLSRVSRAAMLERLRFHTPPDGSQEADERDLKVSKELYIQYLDNVWKTLRRALRKQHRNSQERRQQVGAGAASGVGAGPGAGSLRHSSSESIELGSSNAAMVNGSDCAGSGSVEC
ncbi:GL27046 [Drosophila persimilis]|uniref:GL27046 n=1 Tax=Drosophila persimilis TaxID=7234 RepID=B4H7K8_DROPE|nr:GL27046 [Drosophila persimilis]